jgi:hypothetical protein
LRESEEVEDHKLACRDIADTLQVSIVIPDTIYTAATSIIMESLFTPSGSSHLNLIKVDNGWGCPVVFDGSGATGSVGMRCLASFSSSKVDSDKEVVLAESSSFLIQFHTPSSLVSSRLVASSLECYKKSATSKQRKGALEKARRIDEAALVPAGAKLLLSFGDAFHSE